ncbi:Thioredoxin reductase (Fragment) [Seminavis robusta]|uniref:Thioredoxin reductase n=1 Tax=Seminavis robusta TaxID=568900 RepID=A0A9N8HSZ9_9STRA
MMNGVRLALLFWSVWIVEGRPIVRNIRSTHEFDRLIEKHTTETGLPVVVDFYSDSCGPCRMMAPIFKKVAQEMKDTTVFVKIDTNAQYELSSRFQVRSLPTFMWFVGDPRNPTMTEKGGIGEQRLRQSTQQAIRQAEHENVAIELEAFQQYYQEMDANKPQADVESLYQKCAKKTRGSKECVGGSATQLLRKLKKKYGKGPPTKKRYQPQPTTGSDESSGGSKEDSTKKARKPRGSSGAPNLHLATKEQLQVELEKRLDEERDAQVEDEAEDEEEPDPDFKRWTPGPFPQPITIIGGGPAGMSAAIYAARAGLNPLIIAPSMGGQLQGKGVDVENYPALANVTGPAVIALMRHQAAKFGAAFEDDMVLKIDTSKRPFTIHTNETGAIETHSIIVATGAESKWLGIPGEYELRGGGVSSCATCDGFLFAGKEVLVVGGGDTAMEDALVLARTSSKVTLIHRRDTFRASKVMAERVINHPVIEIKWNTTLDEIVGQTLNDPKAARTINTNADEAEEEELDMDSPAPQASETPQEDQMVVKAAIVKNVNTGEKTEITVDAVFVAIGHTPATSFLEGIVDFDPSHPGYVKTVGTSTYTSLPGIFAAGDVADSVYRQAITSAGSGAAAALDAERWLSEEGLGNEAAEMEAELMRELMEDGPGDSSGAYNAYEDAAARVAGVKESLGAEL